MRTVCTLNTCNGCRACSDKCNYEAIHISDEYSWMNAYIDPSRCINCNQCINVCPNNHPVEMKKPIIWKQGWACSEDIREKASSGGIASAIIESFILNGGYVCTCKYENGSFIFCCTNNLDEIGGYAGSKYVKSNAKGAYRIVEQKLKEGQKVLFIGLPCQSAALLRYIPLKYHNLLYRIDLICHGTPSPELLESFIKKEKIDIGIVRDVSFRQKDKFVISIKQKEGKEKSIPNDIYMHAFLDGIDYTLNCYKCTYAQTRRCSDITLGDSWGTELKNEAPKGVSLVLCQTEKGKELIRMSDIHLEDVNIDRAIQYNHQLMHPTTINSKTDLFFRTYRKTKSFSCGIFRIEPFFYIKQRIKAIIYK